MRASGFIIFFSIVLLIWGSANYYVYIRGMQALPDNNKLRLAYRIFFICVACVYFLNRFIERVWVSPLTSFMSWLGSFWLAAILYFVLILVVIDIARLFNNWFHYFPPFMTANYAKTKLVTAMIVVEIVVLILLGGFINARYPRTKELTLQIHKKAHGLKQLKIVALSDIHFGTTLNNGRLAYMVNRVNNLKPDIVLLAGDIISEEITPILKYDIGYPVREIKAPLGVYAITGNHEFIGGVENACKYLEGLNIKVLRDSTIKINDQFYIIGRDDKSNRKRKTIADLIANLDMNLPAIMLDHQPFNLGDVAKNKIDLQISGHTHAGQIWPFTHLINAMYEVPWGYKKINSTNFYVSSGYGTWGPPVRTGNRPELVCITLQFD